VSTYEVIAGILVSEKIKICELLLDNNCGSDNGAIVLSKALQTNYNLTFLSLRFFLM
jgi:hypothetical protein